MKELSIEEKAKRFDDALKMAKECITYIPDEAVNKYMLSMFPELKESEDDKIRKGIICGMNALKDQKKETFAAIPIDDCVAWLEKQGEKILKNKREIPSKEYIFAIWELGNIWKELTGGSSCTEYGNQLQYIQNHWSESSYYEKLKQNHTDDIEPKFKVGDFIVSDYCMGRVVEITNDAYLLDNGQGISFPCDNARLWDITKDAKEGDVLVAPNGTIFIFKNIIHSMPYSYCGIDCTVRFRNAILEGGTDGRNWTSSLKGIYPATKEQRYTLERAIADAGYTWNEKELKLEKI